MGYIEWFGSLYKKTLANIWLFLENDLNKANMGGGEPFFTALSKPFQYLKCSLSNQLSKQLDDYFCPLLDVSAFSSHLNKDPTSFQHNQAQILNCCCKFT